MFSDTHFHFHHLTEERKLDGQAILRALAERDTFFGLDIGTRADDLFPRKNAIDGAISGLSDELKKRTEKFIQFSAGIWPDVGAIKNRDEDIARLEENIRLFNKNGPKKIIAIGECGLDHHWNPSGADGRCEEDFDQKTFNGEMELFQMQIELAKKMELPLIVHSRDAFEGTIDCLKNMDFHNGIIHCYSYGLEEARKFLDEGWYLAFGGGTTYTKKSKMEEMLVLLRYVPDDRILMETDAPYLAPVPFRGQTNTPVLIEYCYNFVANARKTSPQQLSELVDKNIKILFNL